MVDFVKEMCSNEECKDKSKLKKKKIMKKFINYIKKELK